MYVEIVAPRLLGVLAKISAKFGSIDRIYAQTIWPVILSKEEMDPDTAAHEGTHAVQQMLVPLPIAMLFVAMALIVDVSWLWGLAWCWFPYLGPFYAWYGLEYLVRLAVYRDGKKAYRMICFEQQAWNADARTGVRTDPSEWLRALKEW